MRIGPTIDRRKSYSLVTVLDCYETRSVVGYAILRQDQTVFAEYSALSCAVLALHDLARYAGDIPSMGASRGPTEPATD